MLIKLSIPILFLFYLSAKADSLDRIRYDIVDQSANSTLRPTPAHCLLPADHGHGLEFIESWYFDHESGKCEEFHYLGRDGNANRFESEFECMTNCTGDPCRKVKVGGVEFGALEVNGKFQECKYDGKTKHDNCPRDYYCSMHIGVCCRQETTDVCSLPKAEGTRPGNSYEKRRFFFYNKETNTCESFMFNGAGGNQNRFEKKTQCDLACVKQSCSNGQPFSKMQGPVHCDSIQSSSAESNEEEESNCPLDYRCVNSGIMEKINYCCKPAPKQPSGEDIKWDEAVSGSSSIFSSFTKTLVIVLTTTFAAFH